MRTAGLRLLLDVHVHFAHYMSAFLYIYKNSQCSHNQTCIKFHKGLNVHTHKTLPTHIEILKQERQEH